MNKNQKGFGVAEVLFITVIVGLIGFLSWYAWQTINGSNAQQSSNSEQDQAGQNNQSADNANLKNYSRYGLSFKYPADWELDANDTTQSRSTYLTSPDFAAESTKGEQITVDEVQFTPGNLTADNFKAEHLDPNPSSYSDYKVLSVNDKKAIQFYRGDSRTTVFFLDNGKFVTFVLDKFPDKASASATYDQVIASVAID